MPVIGLSAHVGIRAAKQTKYWGLTEWWRIYQVKIVLVVFFTFPLLLNVLMIADFYFIFIII